MPSPPEPSKASSRASPPRKPAVKAPPTKDLIRRTALDLGFDVVRFAKAETSARTQKFLHDFVADGLHGDMSWLSDTAARRANPRTLWPEARSVIVVGLNYGPGQDPRALLQHTDHGVVSVYARNKDYHDVLKKKLRRLAMWLHEASGAEVKLFVDTAPVMEKPLAQSAGMGWQGKHTNLVSREFGSWLFLGEVFTTLDLEPDVPETDHCGECRKCLDVCPTNAFIDAYRIDARRCISYLTIEHKGHISHELRPLMGNRIYGCDDCLAVCPWNKFAQLTAEPDFLPRAELAAPRLSALAQLDDAAFRALFAGSPIKRIGRDRFVRNVLIAIGNSADAGLSAAAEKLIADESGLVRAAAIWALKRLAPQRHQSLARDHAAREIDAEVRSEWL
jgi:epoxyqueuosine reductase